ncbi:hypothetical protein B0H21DRAFT_814779 [Amylocystis lapponica]|nr:hypothetical protein B0H21DRAFT_814779 [Amylocystis lapponica]
MPPGIQGLAQSISQRRPVGSSRQRENRIQPVPSTSARRRKSRSPDARVVEEVATRTDSTSGRKKKRGAITTNDAVVRLSSADDPVADRGRKPKTRTRASTAFTEEGDVLVLRELAPSSGSLNGKNKRKERSRSRDTSQRLSKKAVSPARSDDNEQPQPVYNGPLAVADYTRMKLEMEGLKKDKSAAKKTIKQQKQELERLRQELEALNKSKQEQSQEVDRLKVQTKKSEETMTSIEANLSCHICMDVLVKPYGLSPCGHVLCQVCLQEWFRSAPPADDEMFDDEMPQMLLYRKKTCPCCRAVVRSRPIPLFIVKSILAALEKGKTTGAVPRAPSPVPDPSDDPWAGIFMEPSLHDDIWGDVDDDGDEVDYDDDEDDEDDEDEDDEDDEDRWSDGYGTPAGDEPYEGPYVRPRWAPPSAHVASEDYSFLDELRDDEMAILRRGATLQMIDLFSMSYTHTQGLKAIVDENNIVYLGWNISLHPDDESGEEYMDWITSDIYDRPERWEVEHEDEFGSWTAWKLMPATDDVDYDTSDSEAWAGDLWI